MNTRNCSRIVTRAQDNTTRLASHWRRGVELAGWTIPGAMLDLLPKCPVCIATYVAVFSGVGISLAGASVIRISLLILCVASLLCLARKLVCRLAPEPKVFRD